MHERQEIDCTEIGLAAVGRCLLYPFGDACGDIPEPVGRPDVMLLRTAQTIKFMLFHLFDDLTGRQGAQMFDGHVKGRSPGDKGARHANQVAMGIDEHIESGR
ncbi:MAG: hypothetical protein DI605_15105 [Sphingomonas sp.]|nr:MAG: hypothetical protein DI605_15105 [Sphingomonas sp.]